MIRNRGKHHQTFCRLPFIVSSIIYITVTKCEERRTYILHDHKMKRSLVIHFSLKKLQIFNTEKAGCLA